MAKQLFNPCPIPPVHIILGVVNAYEAVPQPKNPLKEVDFLFDRMFCRKIFFVFSSSKEEYLRKPTFQMYFPVLWSTLKANLLHIRKQRLFDRIWSAFSGSP